MQLFCFVFLEISRSLLRTSKSCEIADKPLNKWHHSEITLHEKYTALSQNISFTRNLVAAFSLIIYDLPTNIIVSTMRDPSFIMQRIAKVLWHQFLQRSKTNVHVLKMRFAEIDGDRIKIQKMIEILYGLKVQGTFSHTNVTFTQNHHLRQSIEYLTYQLDIT